MLKRMSQTTTVPQPSAPPTDHPKHTMTTKDQAHLQFRLDIVLDANGEDHDYLGQRINSAIAQAIGNGALTGDTAAEVDTHNAQMTLLTPGAVALDEEIITKWLTMQIKDGHMELDRIPLLMARYALADPAQMREEIAERMQMQAEEAVEDLGYAWIGVSLGGYWSNDLGWVGDAGSATVFTEPEGLLRLQDVGVAAMKVTSIDEMPDFDHLEDLAEKAVDPFGGDLQLAACSVGSRLDKEDWLLETRNASNEMPFLLALVEKARSETQSNKQSQRSAP
jgi:hypothetical protein